MTRYTTGCLLTMALLSSAMHATAQPRGRRPPPAAFEACSGKSEGDRCTVDTPRGTMEGTCALLSEEEELVCWPDKFGDRRPPR
ncbi:MAG: hypothetical protein AAGF92_20155 [Myxococcota bacterium]